MNLSVIEGELLGAEPLSNFVRTATTATLANGARAEVGMRVYFTADGVKKIVDEMFRVVGAKNVTDLVVKGAALFGQQVDSERVHALTSKLEDQIKTLSEKPVTVMAISGKDRVDVRGGPPENRSLTGIPSAFLTVKTGAFDFLNYVYGPLPLWGWSLVGLSVLGAGIFVVRKGRKA